MSTRKKGNRQSKRYWLKRRIESFDRQMYTKRLARNKYFRKFVDVFAELSDSGRIFTAKGLHRNCRSYRVRVSQATIYNYLRRLDVLELVDVKFDGSKSWYSLRVESPLFGELVETIDLVLKQAYERARRRR